MGVRQRLRVQGRRDGLDGIVLGYRGSSWHSGRRTWFGVDLVDARILSGPRVGSVLAFGVKHLAFCVGVPTVRVLEHRIREGVLVAHGVSGSGRKNSASVDLGGLRVR